MDRLYLKEIVMKEVVIIDVVRILIGKFGGSLKDISVVDFGVIVLKGVLERVNIVLEWVD